MYQYAECGLPYIYLAGGYRLEDGPYGETLAVEDVDALHRAITRWIVENLDRLRGREVRFLRLEMDRTQAELAADLAVTEQTVSLWERQPDKAIPKPSDRLLRLLAEAWLDDHQSIAGAFSRVRQASGRHGSAEQQSFQRVASRWQAAA